MLTAGLLISTGGGGGTDVRAEEEPVTVGAPSASEPTESVAASLLDRADSAPSIAGALVDDVYDKYRVVLPEGWIPVTTAGADLCYRNTLNVEQNLFVTISSKSSSKYTSLAADLGSPEAAGKQWLAKYLGEFMSTRLGIRRGGRVVATSERVDSSGRPWYDILINIDSYAARNQYGISTAERPQSKEWDRYFLTTIGIANQRLYELRLQSSVDDFMSDRDQLLGILQSFSLYADEELT